MAVEAHHLHLLPSHLLNNRDFLIEAEHQSEAYDSHMGLLPPATGTAAFSPFYNPLVLNTPVAAASDSGLTFNNFSTAPVAEVTRKRPRDSGGWAVSFLGEDISGHVQQQMLDVDRLILQHAEKVRMELLERRRRFSRQLQAAIEQGVAKRLRAKDEEIQRIGRVNWALEERIRSLCVENQIWRDLAETNEATANVLRSNLEQVLAAQMRVKEEQGGETADDAESCCCGENAEELYRPATAAAEKGVGSKVCRNCRESEPEVLLLPCRHLCLCAACGSAASECPVCHAIKDVCVVVNMS